MAPLKTSSIGMHPDCAAGTAKPAPTVAALSLKGLQEGVQKMSRGRRADNRNQFAPEIESYAHWGSSHKEVVLTLSSWAHMQ